MKVEGEPRKARIWFRVRTRPDEGVPWVQGETTTDKQDVFYSGQTTRGFWCLSPIGHIENPCTFCGFQEYFLAPKILPFERLQFRPVLKIILNVVACRTERLCGCRLSLHGLASTGPIPGCASHNMCEVWCKKGRHDEIKSPALDGLDIEF